MDTHKSIPEEYIDSYASSFARLKFFSIHFSNSHPACVTEANLLEINESKLRSSILMNVNLSSMSEYRSIIESNIKKRIQIKLAGISENEKTTNQIMSSINSSDFDLLFDFSQ